MKFLALVALAACVPSRSTVYGPVEREVTRRIGVQPETEAAVAKLLESPIDRDAAVRIALAMNKRLRAQYDGLGIAAADVASATVLRPTEVDVETKLVGGSFEEIEVDVTQDVLDLILIAPRRGAAQADLAAARARAIAATVELVARVEGAYLDVIAAQQELDLRQTTLDAASAAAEIAERQHAAGNIADVVLFRQRDQRDQAQIDLTRTKTEVDVARAALDELLGVGESKWTVGNRLPDLPDAAPPLETLEADAIAQSLALAALRAEQDAAESRRTVARVRSVLPELGVGVAADRHDDEWTAGPAISIGIPLFDQQQGPRARANAEIKRARSEASATDVEIRAQARAIRQRVAGAYAEARQLRDVIVPQRQRIVDETLKQYNAMNASTFELLTARRELVDGGRQYIDALRRFWRASADARALARGGMPHGAPVEPRMEMPATQSGGH